MPRLLTAPDAAFLGEFVAKASGYAAQRAFFALPSERDCPRPTRAAHDVFLTAELDEYCPRRVTHVFKDDLADQPSSDSEDESGAAVLRMPVAQPPAALGVPNRVEAHCAELDAQLRRCKLMRVMRLQTLKADVSGYALSAANRLML